jgi:hypothetical protein
LEVNKTISREQITAAIGKTAWLNPDDIITIARLFALNVIIACAPGLRTFINNNEEVIITLVDTAAVSGMSGGHCLLAKIISTSCSNIATPVSSKLSYQDIIETLNLPPSTGLNVSTTNDDVYLSYSINLDYKLSAGSNTQTGLGQLVLTSESCVWNYPDNASRTDFKIPQIHAVFDPKYERLLSKLISLKGRLKDYERHELDTLPTSMEKFKMENLQSLINQACDIIDSPIQAQLIGNLTKFKKVKLEPATIGAWITIEDCQAKTFDIVYLKHFGPRKKIITPGIIKLVRGNKYLVDFLGEKVVYSGDLGFNKCSLGSIIRKAVALLSCSDDTNKVEKLLTSATGMNGPPGCGKSCGIVNTSADDVIVATTSGAVNRLKLLLKGSQGTIISVEKLMSNDLVISKPRTLYIDEANLCHWIVAARAAHLGFQNLVLLGDLSQIAYKDMSNDAGIRGETNLLKLAMTYTTKINSVLYTHRLPLPLIQMLNRVGIMIEPHKDNKKSWLPKWVNVDSYQEAANLINNVKPDVALTMYKRPCAKLSALTEVPVKTVHSQEGIEVHNLVLVLVEDINGNWGLNGDIHYLYVALTRAADDLTIVVIGRPLVTDLALAATSKMGGRLKDLLVKYKPRLSRRGIATIEEVQSRMSEPDSVIHADDSFEALDQSLINSDSQNADDNDWLDGLANVQDERTLAQWMSNTRAKLGQASLKISKGRFSYCITSNPHNTVMEVITPTQVGFTIKMNLSEKLTVRTVPNLPIPKSLILPNLIWSLQSMACEIAVEVDGRTPKLSANTAATVPKANPVEQDPQPGSVTLQPNTLSNLDETTFQHLTSHQPEKEAITCGATLNWEAINNLRFLAWMLDMAGARCMVLPISDGNNMVISRNNQCPVRSKLTITWKNCTLAHNENPKIFSCNQKNNATLNYLDDVELLHWISGLYSSESLPPFPNATEVWLMLLTERLTNQGWSTPKTPDLKSMASADYSVGQIMYCSHKWHISKNLLEAPDGLINTKTSTKQRLPTQFNLSWLFAVVEEDMRAMTLAFTDCNCCGRDTALEGLTIPISQHMKHDTEVAKLLTKAYTKEVKSNAAKTQDMIWATNVSTTLTTRLRNVVPRIPVARMVRETVTNPWMHTMESTLAMAYGSKRMNQTVVWAGHDLSIPANQNMHYCRYLIDQFDVWKELQVASKPKADQLINSFYNAVSTNSTYAGIEQLIVDELEVADSIVMFGFNLLSKPTAQLRQLINKRNTIYGLLPNEPRSHYYNHTTTQTWMENLKVAVNKNHELLDGMLIGKPNTSKVQITVMSRLVDCAVVKIESYCKQPKLITHNYFSPSKTEVLMPYINNNIMSLAAGESLLLTRRVSIDLRLYRSIMLKTLSVKGDRSKIAAHVRSIALTEVTSDDYIGLDKDIDPEQAINTIGIAILHQDNIVNKFGWLKMLISKAQGNPIPEAFISQLLGLVMNASNVIGQVANEVKEVLLNYVDTLLSEKIIAELKDNQQQLMLWIDKSQDRLIDWDSAVKQNDESNRRETNLESMLRTKTNTWLQSKFKKPNGASEPESSAYTTDIPIFDMMPKQRSEAAKSKGGDAKSRTEIDSDDELYYFDAASEASDENNLAAKEIGVDIDFMPELEEHDNTKSDSSVDSWMQPLNKPVQIKLLEKSIISKHEPNDFNVEHYLNTSYMHLPVEERSEELNEHIGIVADVIHNQINAETVQELTIDAEYVQLLKNLHVLNLCIQLDNSSLLVTMLNKMTGFQRALFNSAPVSTVKQLVIAEFKKTMSANNVTAVEVNVCKTHGFAYLTPNLTRLINTIPLSETHQLDYDTKFSSDLLIEQCIVDANTIMFNNVVADAIINISETMQILVIGEADVTHRYKSVLMNLSNVEFNAQFEIISSLGWLISNNECLVTKTLLHTKKRIVTSLPELDDRLTATLTRTHESRVTRTNWSTPMELALECRHEPTFIGKESWEDWNLKSGLIQISPVKLTDLTTIYNPDGSHDCVVKCCTEVLLPAKLIDKLPQPVTMSDMVEWAWSNNIKCALVQIHADDDFGLGLTTCDVSSVEFVFGLITQNEYLHCVVITGKLSVVQTCKVTRIGIPSLCAAPNFNRPDELNDKVTTLNVGDAKAKLIGNRREHDLARSKLTLCNWDEIAGKQYVTVNASLLGQNKTLTWLSNTNGFELHILKWHIDNEFATAEVTATGTYNDFLIIYTTVMTKKKEQLKISSDIQNMSWTYNDKELLSARGIECVQYRKGMKGHIVLINYDNRDHHNGENLLDVAASGKVTISIYGRKKHRKFIAAEYAPTHNASTNRKVLRDSETVLLTECTNVVTSHILARLNNRDVFATEIIGEVELDYSWPIDTITSLSGAKSIKIKQCELATCLKLVDDDTLRENLSTFDLQEVDWNDRQSAKAALTATKIVLTNENVQILTFNSTTIVLFSNLSCFVLVGKMGYQHKQYPLSSQSKAGDWFGMKEHMQVLNKQADPEAQSYDFVDAEFMTAVIGPKIKDWPTWMPMNGVISGKWTTIITDNEDFDAIYPEVSDAVRDELTLDSYDFWTMFDSTYSTARYGPNTTGYLKSKETSNKTYVFSKHSLTQYPEKARPVATKMLYKIHNTITGRLMSVLTIRRNVPKPSSLLNKMAIAYFHNDSAELCSAFQSSPIQFNTIETIAWIKKHHRAAKVLEDLKQFSTAGSLYSSISDINIHLKLESLLKTKVIQSWMQQQPRSIMWQNYFVSALFSPIFIEVKRRMKLLLHDKFIYADGCTPEEIQSMLSNKRNVKFFFENDLEKQDRQTDKPIIQIELAMYEAVGCHADVLWLWQTVHEIWRFKSAYSWGFSKEMRLTGQATTSLGNWNNDMQTHADFIADNLDELCYVMMTGDDNNAGFSSKVDISNLNHHIATSFNMVSSARLDDKEAAFCCFLTTKYNDKVVMVPDLHRLRHRFEVTNGVSEVTENNIRMRTLSYLLMLGKTEQGNLIGDNINEKVTVRQWYPMSAAISATAAHYNLTIGQVENDVKLLLNDMQNCEVTEHSWEVWKPARC